ncbi:LOW QUALITY PROTEIN: uncharacterized protein LOC120282969 [Dioscorea cayenensis subsp. rotundata]|uniref:LOW QUALITY PROTEIN: uncharacterized protein LOC120282969 n=1 Tax=Dioscorea cayennensis subsp. rotundata TaxID=55577 RepID=A0AB40D0M2_DIOCR|nr:LOW QUALITY PROTEIN: uncharacterized protein LOC120282969 [Dioscorea cayenensis subsp. rotundata]
MHVCRQRHSRSVSGVHQDVLSISPRLSTYNSKISLERKLHDRNSSFTEKMVSGCNSSNSIGSSKDLNPKPTSELVKEIATLELEVINLERYLLSLYRTAFDQYRVNSQLECIEESSQQKSKLHIEYLNSCEVNSDHQASKEAIRNVVNEIQKKRDIDIRHAGNISAHDLASTSNMSNVPFERDEPYKCETKSISSHRSLADHMGASLMDHVPNFPCRISEEIVRCIAAIYCKLANHPPVQQTELPVSPTLSLSTSSTYSPQDPNDNWSPRCNFETTSSPPRLCNPYSNMIEVPKITVDEDKFDYASKMLNIFRSLIKQLEVVNPRKMKHEQQLAFWINIHNALVMHAFLAYGLHQNMMKSTFSILKAAYNIGGQSINVYDIQNSILRCQSHRPSTWLQALYTTAISFKKPNDKHSYALDHPEPLAHFTLSSGAYSDPAVRVYTAKSVHQEMKQAREEFIQSNTQIKNERKINLPKLLHYYTKDASLELPELLKIICDCLPLSQQKLMQRCLKGRTVEKCIEWSPYKTTFRFLLHRDLDKQKKSLHNIYQL